MKLLLILSLLCPLIGMGQKNVKERQLTEGVYLVPGGEIAKDHIKGKLIKIERTMKGQKHYFLTDTSGIIFRYYQSRLILDSCYQVYNKSKN